MILLGADLSQAESRVVFALTGDPRMLEIARAKPWERDMHTENAALVFGVPESKVTKEQRQVGKIVSHGAQRNMQGPTLSDHIAKSYGMIISGVECQRFIDSYMRRHAPLETHYFRELRKLAVRHRALSNSFGRVIYFEHDPLEDGLFREMYSWLPQSNVADLTNQWGLIPLATCIRGNMFGPGAAVNAQGHDSVAASVRPQYAYDMAWFLQYRMERSNYYWGNELSIPVEFSLGSTWDYEYTWKRLPPRAEFEAAAWECEARVRGLRLEEEQA